MAVEKQTNPKLVDAQIVPPRPTFAGGGMQRGPGGMQRGMTVVKPKKFFTTLIRLWDYFGRERKLLAVILLLAGISAGIGLLVPYLMGRAIDTLNGGQNHVAFPLLFLVIIAFGVSCGADTFVQFLQGWLMAGVSQRIISGLRRSLFAKLQKLPVAFFDMSPHGDLMSRLSNDIDMLNSTISSSTTQLLSNAIVITGSFIMMLVLSPLLALAALITLPLVFLLTNTVSGKTRKLFKDQQAMLGRLNGQIEETITGIQVVKAFNRETRVIDEFAEANSSLCDTGIKALIWSGYIMPLMNVINNLGFAAIAGVGGLLAVHDMITVGIIASFLSYSRQFVRPLNDFANIYNTLQSAMAGAERVFEVLDEREEPPDTEQALALTTPRGKVSFEDVSFSYRADVPVLQNINFNVQPGGSVALVGHTGAGKTTIVNLLARFYEASQGRILIDDRDIREYTKNSLRGCFSIVLQDTYLFAGTIRENIRYGRLTALDSEVEAAAVTANADAFIRRLPNGYDTTLTESGVNLSEGQRQLIAIARAILADGSILILDEATSSVDTRTERHIQQAMLRLMQGRTSFIIAHRLSTIRDADLIMVIDNGRLVEKGNHASLMQQRGAYYNLYASQLKHDEKP